MTDESTDAGWFRGLDPGDLDAARDAIDSGRVDAPADWPSQAVEAGFVDDEDNYYSLLQDSTIHATREVARERERADDQQLIHAVRAMDDCGRVANELAERVAEWAGSLLDADVAGVADARAVADHDPETPPEVRLVSLAGRVDELAAETASLRSSIERQAPAAAPNLAAMAGPVLAARLIALAGGLADLAKLPSSTVQVLGAEDALFAHLRGHGTSPKHGVIFTHDYVRNTAPDERGSAARAVAGKLTIAARVDHYSGERRPGLDEELDERIERIRSRDRDGGADG
jgi:nucleolar protein 56